MILYTKESLVATLKEIAERGWIPNARPGNAGGVGNTLEDLLGIEENNLPIPNAAEWELKCQRIGSSSLTTLLHTEPSPRAIKFVPKVFLPLYGWPHQTIPKEQSFRQTIHSLARSDRGFKVVVDRDARKVLVSFDAHAVDPRHTKWLALVKRRAGLGELNPQPYWGFDDLCHEAGTKLLNCFYVLAGVKRDKRSEFFHYKHILILEKFDPQKFLGAIETGAILVDFDARTHHNHGTKFRFRRGRRDRLPDLFRNVYRSVRIVA